MQKNNHPRFLGQLQSVALRNLGWVDAIIKQQSIMATRRRDKGKSVCSMFAPSLYGHDDADSRRGEGRIAQEAINDDAGCAPSFF